MSQPSSCLAGWGYAGSDCPTGVVGQCAGVEFDANTSGVWQVGVEIRGCANPTLRYALWVTVDGEEAPLTLAQVDEPAFIWTTVTTVYRMDLMATQK